MLALEDLCAQAIAHVQPYRWVIQQARCRACGNVHEREIGLMREHAPGSWIRVMEEAEQTAHMNAPVEFQPAILAWCEICNSESAKELTKLVRSAIDAYGNTSELAKALETCLGLFYTAQTKERFHRAKK